ncbi:hypothetical protein ACH47Z_19335 [Streptomyces sp. NPDC020192]|uniref:hypothetical protein n=1 Tax=Streptomyces sp. NPDC020192 TaxID=3365066 RepID=UPI0037AC9196
MGRPRAKTLLRLCGTVLPALAASAAWAVWLGWDQHRDVHPDGTTTGPYQAWQVAGLVLTLLATVCWAAWRHHAVGAVLGTTAGLTVAAYADWSDDSSGLFVIGVGLVMLGSLVGALIVAAVTCAFHPYDGSAPGLKPR